MRRLIIAGVIGLTLSAPASAHDEAQPPAAPLFGGIVQERDVGLVFDYLREALGAAVEGREAPAPDEITQRAEAIGEEMKRRGAAAARVFLDMIEKRVREGLREPAQRRALPPSTGYQRL